MVWGVAEGVRYWRMAKFYALQQQRGTAQVWAVATATADGEIKVLASFCNPADCDETVRYLNASKLSEAERVPRLARAA